MPRPIIPLHPPIPTRPLSQQVAGRATSSLAILRTHFNISTWLALGALLQSLLILLPMSKVYAFTPVLFFLALRTIDHTLILLGWRRNPYMDGVTPGKVTALIPGCKGEPGIPGQGSICVVLLTVRSNHPNGIFASTFRAIGAHASAMDASLNAQAATNGYLGGTTYLNASDRTTTPEIMTSYYFDSRASLHAFAHSPVHRAGWDWYAKLGAAGNGRISIGHEVFEAPAGSWENVYGNFTPTGMGKISFPRVDAEGRRIWVSPLVDAAKGRLRTNLGRQGINDGADNEKYGADWAAEV